MSAILQEQYAIPVITCSLALPPLTPDQPSEDPRVRFQLQVGTEMLHDVSVSSTEMKLPPTLKAIARNAGVRKLYLPQRVIDEFRRQLKGRPAAEPIWLRLGSPSGHLAAVPWEHLFQPRLRAPVLRLPEVALPALATGPPLEIVVCASQPRTRSQYDLREQLANYLDEVRDTVPGATRVTVFTDLPGGRSEFEDADHDIKVHELTETVDAGVTERPGGTIENTWLRWVAATLGDASVDVAHFICPGHLASSFGALWLDARAETTSGARGPLVQAAELCAFLAHVGAWATGFTIPSVRSWPAGIRVLAHRVMKELTGPVVIDAPHHRKGAPGVGAAYRLLFGPPPIAAPCSPGLAIYVHPQRVHEAVPAAAVSESALFFETRTIKYVQDLTLAGTPLEEKLTSETEPPRWLAASQRALERVASELLIAGVNTKYTEAAHQGVHDALKFMQRLLAEHTDELPDRNEPRW
jgi:hypothetical protein